MESEAFTVDAATTQIAASLAAQLLETPGSIANNLVFSPSSVHAALAVLMLSAKGETKAQLKSFLGGESDETVSAVLRAAAEVDPTLSCALGVFALQSGAFQDALDVGAHIEHLPPADANAVARVNAWVAEATRGRIPRIIASIDATTGLIVVSAIHFGAEWVTPFKPQATLDQPFVLRSGDAVQRKAMHQTATYDVSANGDWRLLELPYRQSDFAMLIALPEDDTARLLNFDAVTAAIDKLEPKLVQLRLPRFNITSELSLASALVRAGVIDVFDPALADLSALSKEPIHAGGVIHKACVAVDELGTEAAAATAVPLPRSFNPQPKIPFIVDRPFWFLIRDRRTGALIFVGRVEDPAG